MKKIILSLLIIVFSFSVVEAEDGYNLWLRYDLINDTGLLHEYQNLITCIHTTNGSSTLKAATEELRTALKGLLGKDIDSVNDVTKEGILIIGTPARSREIKSLDIVERLSGLGDDGYIILSSTMSGKKAIVITANSDIGVLYGVFHFLRLLQTHQDIKNISIRNSPRIKVRVLNHWDNLDRTVERGYAGFSIWDWHKLPDFVYPRYKDYARANASIGINGTVLTNVNANSLALAHEYLLKVAALAELFRPYGIRVYLTARFNSPMELGGLETADPLVPEVAEWWNKKAKEIYDLIPDFGGFLVKANSEGQPGPQNYGRTHVDGANMLADAVKPFGGIVMWRAFVYSYDVNVDRAKQAYNEFHPFDGMFRDNVLIQVKNGPVDFQPREPFHPLFGAMPKTPLMMEFQITQEYLGQATSLVFLSTLYKETLQSDTYAKGKASTISKIIDGSLDNHSLTGIAGVANIGTDRNWTGHTFGQSNWYAFGRLAWDHELTSGEIAEEWIRMTFSNSSEIIDPVKSIMQRSRETVVNYMAPLGLHHIMGWDHHYGPSPWIKNKFRDDWTSVYYHQADNGGIGFDRTATGSNAVNQYYPPVENLFSSPKTCPDKYLLWFHHLSWDYKLTSNTTLWDELCYKYFEGVKSIKSIRQTWNSLKGKIDEERFERVKMLFDIQVKEAIWWRDACVLYFQTFSKKQLPEGLEKPEKSLEYYMNLRFPYAPGIRPKW